MLGFMKAPVDAYRVASGQKQQQGDPVDPLAMLTIGKVLEMVLEAIPALILQIAILMPIADPSMVTVVSIARLRPSARAVGRRLGAEPSSARRWPRWSAVERRQSPP